MNSEMTTSNLKESLQKALQVYDEAMAEARQEHEKAAKLDRDKADRAYLTKRSDACVEFIAIVQQLIK
jgi:predicted RNA polymerase sigma factor